MKLIEKGKMQDIKVNVLPAMVAIVLIASLVLSCLPVYATGTGVTATVLNAVPTVSVELTPDDVPATPGVQVINHEPATTNKTVTITATVRDLNGWDDIVNTSITATITGPSVIEDSPLNLCFDSIVNLTTATYTGSFNMSNHLEGDYKVEVTATDFSGSTGAGAKNFTYLYAALPDTTPPAVTNPGANPDSIVADGIHRSQLNITVTDASGIYSVTVDLTEIGAAAEAMTKIEGTDIYTTNTTASVGTSPGTYYLPVNATDNSPNKNSDTSVSIPLTVLPAEAITTYDFTTGAGSDKWAFRKQHFAKPPADNDDPNNKFKVKEYKKIKFDDGTMQADASAANGFYAIHRFKFSVAEPEGRITKLDILWDGKATHDWGTDGATLYVWNFSAGMYEQLVTSNDAYITLEGTITDNIGDYIDDDGSLIIIAEQNTAHWRFGLKFRSRLSTDYVKVDVTYTPKPHVVILSVAPSVAEVHPGDDITFAIDVRNDGAAGYGYVGGDVVYPDGTICHIEWEKTDYLGTGDTYTAHLDWTVPEDAPPGSYGFVSATWDACWTGCEASPCYLVGCCDGNQDGYEMENVFEVVG